MLVAQMQPTTMLAAHMQSANRLISCCISPIGRLPKHIFHSNSQTYKKHARCGNISHGACSIFIDGDIHFLVVLGLLLSLVPSFSLILIALVGADICDCKIALVFHIYKLA
jgi:hypothetical protein